VPSHEWDDDAGDADDARDAIPKHPWDDDDSDPDDDGASEPSVDEESPEYAAKQLIESLKGLYHTSSISAEAVCNITHWAGKAGCVGDVAKYGRPPGTSASHCARHLDVVLGANEYKRYEYDLTIPGHLREHIARGPVRVIVYNAHEIIDEELRADPTLGTRLRELELPRAYYEHPIVQRHGHGEVHPYGLYLDGVAYSNVDTCVGVWIVNLISGKRHVLCSLRKRIICQCGCRGWCSFDALLRWLHWSFKALANASYPISRHDGPWTPDEAWRAAKGGQPILKPACCLQLKGDWLEFCERIGYFPCTSNIRPCLCCTCPKDLLYAIDGLSMTSMPEFWNPHTVVDWDVACSRCEIWVDLDLISRDAITDLLVYDRTKDGPHGRCLREAVVVGGVQLHKGGPS